MSDRSINPIKYGFENDDISCIENSRGGDQRYYPVGHTTRMILWHSVLVPNKNIRRRIITLGKKGT